MLGLIKIENSKALRLEVDVTTATFKGLEIIQGSKSSLGDFGYENEQVIDMNFRTSVVACFPQTFR